MQNHFFKKIKKGKNCVFWSYSENKQFFPYCYNSLFGFSEKRSSTFLKNYLSKGFNLFNSEFYQNVPKIKNYKTIKDEEKIFTSIYSNRLIRAFTTYSDNLEKYENPGFLNFYYDNYGYLCVNKIVSNLKVASNLEKSERKIFFITSEEKKNILKEDQNFDINLLFNIHNPQKNIHDSQNVIDNKNIQDSYIFSNNVFYFESYPYWLNLSEIRKILDFYDKNKSEIDKTNEPNEVLYKFYLEKFYSNFQNEAKKIVEEFIKIQKAWIYLINLVKKSGSFVIIDGSFSDFRFFPFLAGYLPQKESQQQIFDLYLFGDNLTLGLGQNLVILNAGADKDIRFNDIKENIMKIFKKEDPYFNPFTINLLHSNVKRLVSQYHYSILLRYLYLIQSRKDCFIIGPYIYQGNIVQKPFVLPLNIPDEIFYFILRELPNKKTQNQKLNKNHPN